MDSIIKEIHELKQLIIGQSLLQKDVLNFQEACSYLSISASHLYKLTSRKEIPHFCPQGKKLYFNRHELDLWLQQNRQVTLDEIETEAENYLIQRGRRRQ